MAINLNRTQHEVQFNAVKIGKLFNFYKETLSDLARRYSD